MKYNWYSSHTWVNQLTCKISITSITCWICITVTAKNNRNTRYTTIIAIVASFIPIESIFPNKKISSMTNRSRNCTPKHLSHGIKAQQTGVEFLIFLIRPSFNHFLGHTSTILLLRSLFGFVCILSLIWDYYKNDQTNISYWFYILLFYILRKLKQKPKLQHIAKLYNSYPVLIVQFILVNAFQ